MTWTFKPTKTELETEDGRQPLAVHAWGVFFPRNATPNDTLREHYRLINPEYKIAAGLHKKGKYIAMPPKYIEACKEIPYDHPWGGGLAVPRCANVGSVRRVMKLSYPEAERVSLVPEIQLRPYQEVAVKGLLTRGEGIVIAPCGAGKTLTAILSSLTRPGPVCVVAPAKARRVWWDQVQEYTNIVPHRVIPRGQMRRGDKTLEDYLVECREEKRRPFVVFGAQSLPDYVGDVASLEPTVLVIDELHTFGQPKRWKAIFNSNGEVEFEKRRTKTDTRETRAVAAMDVSRLPSLALRVGLTATPLDDGRPRRLWSQLDLLAPGAYGMGFGSFAKRYCAAKEGEYGGLDDKGSSNID